MFLQTKFCPFQRFCSVRLKVQPPVSSCAPRPPAPSPAPACRDSNYRATDGPACLQVFIKTNPPSEPVQTSNQMVLSPVEFPCGRLPDRLNSSAPTCHRGNCPWQVRSFQPITARRWPTITGVVCFPRPGVPDEQQGGGAVWRSGSGPALRPHRRSLPPSGLRL